MTRDELLFSICTINRVYDCCIADDDYDCDKCKQLTKEWFDEYDKHVIEQYKDNHDSVANEMYCKGKADTNLKDTIRDIHDNVAKEMYYKGIDDFANYLVEQGILGSRCISDGEITDYGRVYAKKYKEQLKEQNK